jgi:hypothetical protein
MEDRRAAQRRPVRLFFNKYIDGQPYACEAIELSTSGLLMRRVHEPDAPRACYAIEIAPVGASEPEDRVWLCAASIWRDGDVEALGFVGQSQRDKSRIAHLVANVSQHAC